MAHESEQVARDRRQPLAARHLALGIHRHALELRADRRRAVTRFDRLEDLAEHHRPVVGLTADHHAVRPLERLSRSRSVAQAAVEHDRQVGEVLFEAACDVVAQRRDLAVVGGRPVAEHRTARVHDGAVGARRTDRHQKIGEPVVVRLIEALHRVGEVRLPGAQRPDAHLHRHRDIDHLAHRGDAVRHEVRLVHQARAESALLHLVRRTAAVEVDLVVAPLGAVARRGGEVIGLAATELQRHGVLLARELEQPVAFAAQDRGRGHHLGVEQEFGGEAAQEVAAVPVRPIHHRGDRHASVEGTREVHRQPFTPG